MGEKRSIPELEAKFHVDLNVLPKETDTAFKTYFDSTRKHFSGNALAGCDHVLADLCYAPSQEVRD